MQQSYQGVLKPASMCGKDTLAVEYYPARAQMSSNWRWNQWVMSSR